MKKILLTAIAGSAMLVAGCAKKEDAAPADATATAEATAASDAAASDAGAATDAAGAASQSPNEGTSGGPHP
jgi:nitrous oxide reductase accessory protein NosL